MHFDHYLDASGLCCPMPLLKTKQQLNAMQPGQVLKVTATDEGAVRDFQAFLNLSKHELISMSTADGVYDFYIQCG